MAPPELPSVSGTPAGYGRSCTNCSRAKCKCILRPDGVDCERCHRLGKSCQPMTTSRRRASKKAASSRTAQLEEKLDDLVSILRNQGTVGHAQPATTVTTSYSPNPPFQECSRLESLATAATSTTPEMHSSTLRHAYDGSLETGMVSTNPSIDETWRLPEPTPAEAEVYLNKFRSWLTNFPFMVVPDDMDAASLRHEKPFLWLCIMNVTTMSQPQQLAMKERIRSEVAQRVICNHERSMDILLGLLVFLSWATLNSGPGHKPFLITFSQLATAVVYEMSLTRAPIEEQYFTVCFKVWGGRPPPPKLRTMEERRAVLALWFLTSLISSFIGKMDTLRWTPHMEDCLKSLERDRENALDEVLITFIKLQRVGDEAQKLLVRDVMGEADQTPTYVFKKGLLAQLQEVREGLSGNIVANHVLQAHIHSMEVQVHSVGLFMQIIPQPQRIESMFSCLKAARSWYDIFFAIPLEEAPGMPFALYTQMSQVQVALYRLTTSDDPAWDKDLVRNTADVLSLLDQTIERFSTLDQHYQIKSDDPEGSLFQKGAKIMRNIRASWEPAVSRHLGGIPTPNSQVMASQSIEGPAPSQPSNNPLDTTFWPEHMANMPMDFNDMTWMSDVFGTWEL